MMPAKDRIECVLLLIAACALALVAGAYTVLHLDRTRTYEAELRSVEVPTGDAAILAGERLAKVRGCLWCHGDQLEGKWYFADAKKGVIAVAPNLTRIVREYSPAEFARAIRHGLKADSTSLQPAMPSYAFGRVSDEDIGLLIAYIRSLPESDYAEGRFKLLPLGWFRWTLGRLPPNAADIIDHDLEPATAQVRREQLAYGEYLAETICGECHSAKGREHHAPGTPSLIVASAYSRDAFAELLRTGAALGDRELNYLMVEASRQRFAHFTDAEIDAMHAYFTSPDAMVKLQGLPEVP